MVLPPSTAAEGEATQAEWLREVRRWLHLGHKGVIVMIRDAQLAQLRPLKRELESIDPELVVTSDALQLLECREGALVLFIVREDDLDWLNLNRPIFAQRSLRVVLWVEPELSGRLKFESPDFHDWISHFVPCPKGMPEFAVEGLRIGSSWWPGVAWRGKGLELALSKLGTPAMTLRPDAEFEQLVTTLSAEPHATIRWEGIESSRSLWRVRWALAEARHEGFSVLDRPRVSTPGWFPVHSQQLSEHEARLSTTCGLSHAIELELEPESLLNSSDEATSEDMRIGLLLEPGPALRKRHESIEIAQWRQDLVRMMRQDPDRVWSRAQLAVFASLERDSESWPTWFGQPKQRHSAEHILRSCGRMSVPTGPKCGEALPDAVALSAVLIGDPELVARWGPYEVSVLTEPWFSRYAGKAAIVDPSDVFLLGQTLGWDASDVIRATASHARALLDQPQQLGRFVDDVLTAARDDLGVRDRALLRIEQIGAQALGLAGDPWTARNRLMDATMKSSVVIPFGPEIVALHVLCGEYSRAIQLLEPITEQDPLAELYTAALLASGQADRVHIEPGRLQPDAAAVAREFLRKRLNELAQ